MATAKKTLKIEVGHRSSIAGARWCKPIGWEPANQISGEWNGSAWWNEIEEEAGIVYFGNGDEGEVIEVDLDSMRVASSGDCRVIGEVAL